jgi:hypothetical protein
MTQSGHQRVRITPRKLMPNTFVKRPPLTIVSAENASTDGLFR